MSNLVEKGKYPPDMSPKEIADLERFIEDGMPGVALKAEQLSSLFQLYLNGASYNEISIKLGIKKYIVTYHCVKNNYYKIKMDTLQGMAQVVQQKIDIAGLRGVDLMADVMTTLELYYRDILNRYMATRDPRIIESADFENFKMFMKCMETIHKMRNPDTDGKNKSSSMGLNLPNGGILKKIDDNTVEVSPLSSSTGDTGKLGDILRALSEFREKKESK